MIRVRRFLYMAVVVMAMMFLATGCSNERQERQLQLREQGIPEAQNTQELSMTVKLQQRLQSKATAHLLSSLQPHIRVALPQPTGCLFISMIRTEEV